MYVEYPTVRETNGEKATHQERKAENTECSVAGFDGSLKLLTETRDLMQNLVTQVANIANGKQSRELVNHVEELFATDAMNRDMLLETVLEKHQNQNRRNQMTRIEV